jgi:hypothetical protein
MHAACSAHLILLDYTTRMLNFIFENRYVICFSAVKRNVYLLIMISMWEINWLD